MNEEDGACILTGEPGENADDCTTHEHEGHGADKMWTTATPGPWQWRGETIDGDGPRNHTVCYMNRPDVSESFNEDDAILIAQTPTMYKCLKSNHELIQDAAELLADYHEDASNELVDFFNEIKTIIKNVEEYEPDGE